MSDSRLGSKALDSEGQAAGYLESTVLQPLRIVAEPDESNLLSPKAAHQAMFVPDGLSCPDQW